jgi:O-antigen ligase
MVQTPQMLAQTETAATVRRSAVVMRPRPEYVRLAGPAGVCAYVLGFALPLESDYSLMALAVCALVASVGAFEEARPTHFNPLIASIICFCIVSVASSLLSVRPWSSLASLVPLVPAVLLFVLVSYDFSSYGQIRALFLALSVVALSLSAALIGIALVNPAAAPSEWVRTLDSPIIVVSNDATFFAVLVPVFLSLVYAKPRSLSAAVGALAVILALVAGVLLQSRTAVLTMFVCMLAAAVLRKSRSLMLVSISTPIVVLLVDLILHAQLLAKFMARLVDTRLYLWLSGWDMFLEAPVFGHGPNTFGTLYPQYLSRLDLPAWIPFDPRVVAWPHSLYIEVLAERGLVGMLAMALVIGCGAALAWRVRNGACTEARSVANTALASLTGICFAGLIELTLLRVWVVVLLLLLLGVINFASVRSSRAMEPSAKENRHVHARR